MSLSEHIEQEICFYDNQRDFDNHVIVKIGCNNHWLSEYIKQLQTYQQSWNNNNKIDCLFHIGIVYHTMNACDSMLSAKHIYLSLSLYNKCTKVWISPPYHTNWHFFALIYFWFWYIFCFQDNFNMTA